MNFNKSKNAAAAAGTSPSGSDSQDNIAGLVQNIQLEVQHDNFNLKLKRIKNEFDSERDQNQELTSTFEDVVPKYKMAELIHNEEKAGVQNCEKMMYESNKTKKKVEQQILASRNVDMLEIRKSLDNIKKLGSVNENHINLIKRRKEEVLHQEKIKIADNKKKIENLLKSFEQREADLLQEISETNTMIRVMEEKHDQTKKSVSKTIEKGDALSTEISDLDGISKTLENEEIALIKEVKSSKLRVTDLEQKSKSEESTLTKKLEFMAKREEEMKENLMNLNLEQRNEVSQLKNLDLHDSKLAEETNMLKQKLSKTKLLIEESQANIVELKTNEEKELDILSNINIATQLQMNNNQTLDEELILQLKSYDLEAVERKKLICSAEREIEEVESIINKDQMNFLEIIDKESSICKLNNEEKSKVSALKLQLQEKKDDLNKKSQAFNEEIRKIDEERSKLQVSAEQELEKYKMDLENEQQAAAKNLDDIINCDLNEIENIKKSMEVKQKGTEKFEEEIKNIENEYFMIDTKIDFYQNEKKKTENLMKEQQKPKKMKRKVDFEDDDDAKSDSSYGVPFEDLFKNKMFGKQ